jgi:hypothetical protein
MDLAHLDTIAKKYDLSDPDHRANFRMDVRETYKPTRMSAINEWTGGNHKSLEDAVRALADTYIAKKRGVVRKAAGGRVSW